MNREVPYRDQAERLRQRIERIPIENEGKPGKLPPRSEIHRNKKKKNKWKLKYPVIRLLVLFFILLPITIYSAYTYLEGQNSSGKKEVIGNGTAGYEPIELEIKKDPLDSNKDKETETSGLSIENHEEKKKISLSESITDNDSEASSSEPEGNKDSEPKTTDNESKQKIIYHTVQPHETLFRIAIKYYNSKAGIEIIRHANGIQGNEIQSGQVLKIPIQK
ncbi:peptidoglycan-binding protein LysM [Bacillus methanolicus]|uniref:LysM peptidoglycan-binding domain-containing protein n=1 Tax=Bacillus methanolicus TaxID=1471 RepID=UPI00200F803E|nr:LysM peptidoglycan-binding domain-containing protein [Bacillus methanolicus]UQD52587.1 peptidoglycan-binding protein LysM [Bacillus methanolicus]